MDPWLLSCHMVMQTGRWRDLLRQHILPRRGNTPVVAGVFASDPVLEIQQVLEKLKEMGVEGITNWPAIGFIDGEFRAHIENEGLEYTGRGGTFAKGQGFGIYNFWFRPSAEDANLFASNDVDALILNVGLTFEITDTIEKRNQLQLVLQGQRDDHKRS